MSVKRIVEDGVSIVEYTSSPKKVKSPEDDPAHVSLSEKWGTRQITEYLRRVEIAEVVRENRPIISISEKAPLTKALETFRQQRLAALPVMDEKNEFIGILNAIDIVKLLVEAAHDHAHPLPRSHHQHSDSHHEHVHPVFRKTVGDAMGAARESRFLTVLQGSDPVWKATVLFASGTIHHALVKTPHWTKIVSQTDVARFIARHETEVAGPEREVFKKTLGELDMIVTDRKRHLVQTGTEVSAIEAYQVLTVNETLAMPVLSENGQVLGTLSCSDIRALSPHTAHRLFLPVMEYISENKLPSEDEEDLEMKRTVSCTASTTLEEAMVTMLWEHVHRVWVLDEQQRFVGVVSLSDLLKIFK